MALGESAGYPSKDDCCFQVGERVLVEDKVGTVRWIGKLPRGDGTTTWVGMEYDEAIGKHNGSYNGTPYFVCKEPHGAFVKVPKIKQGVSMVRALTKRYIEPQTEEQEELTMVGCDLKERKIEFVGLQKALDRCADIKTVSNIVLQDEHVSHIGDIKKLWGEDKCTIEILRLDGNLLWQWKDVEYLGEQAPAIKILMMSFNSLGVPKSNLSTGLFKNLEVLALTKSCIPSTDAPFRKDMFKMFAASFPKLKELAVGNNSWTGIPDGAERGQWPNLAKLDLDKNKFCQWDELEKLSNLSSLVHLQISACGLGDLECDIMEFPQLRSVNISENEIAEWKTFLFLSMAWPCLESLRMGQNPFLGKENEFASIARPILTALWPNIQIINGGEVKKQDRLHAERYFLTLHKREHPAVLSLDPDKRIYDRLVEVHGEPGESGTNAAAEAGLISSCLMEVKIQPMAYICMTQPAQVKKIPTSMTVRDLKMLCARLYNFPIEHMRLNACEPGQPVGFPLNMDERELSFWGLAGVGSEPPTIVIEDIRDDTRVVR